jgi:hypothetical protein
MTKEDLEMLLLLSEKSRMEIDEILGGIGNG